MKTTLTCAVCVLCGVGVARAIHADVDARTGGAGSTSAERSDPQPARCDRAGYAWCPSGAQHVQPKVTPNVLGSFGQTNVNSQNYRIDVSQKFVSGTEIRLGAGTSRRRFRRLSASRRADIRFYNADTTLTLSQPLLARPRARRRGRPRSRSFEARNWDARTPGRQQAVGGTCR